MDFSLSTWMMIAFVAGILLSMWKLAPFLSTKTLPDDDNTPEAREELLQIVLDSIKNGEASMTLNELFERITTHEAFDKEHFWRFNPNKLQNLLEYYYTQNPHLNSIEEIYNELNRKHP